VNKSDKHHWQVLVDIEKRSFPAPLMKAIEPACAEVLPAVRTRTAGQERETDGTKSDLRAFSVVCRAVIAQQRLPSRVASRTTHPIGWRPIFCGAMGHRRSKQGSWPGQQSARLGHFCDVDLLAAQALVKALPLARRPRS
jgi:hypothetical protein